MPSLRSSTKQNPTSKSPVFHLILVPQVLPSYQRQCNSDMLVLYKIFDLWFYDSHSWGKTPVYHVGSSRTINLISLSCPLTVSIVWAHLCCCFAFPDLDLVEGSVKKLWVKSCVTTAEFLLHEDLDCSFGDIFGQWLYRLILYMCFRQPFLTYLPCCQWMSPESKSQHHPRNTSSFLQENDLMLGFLTYRIGKNSISELLRSMNWGWLLMDGCSTGNWELSLQWSVVSPEKLCLSICSLDLYF